MSDDHSPGDARQPYSDRGGPEGRHAETHDVVREQLTNPTGPEPEDESFAEQEGVPGESKNWRDCEPVFWRPSLV